MSDEPDIFEFKDDRPDTPPTDPPKRDIPPHKKPKEPGTIDVDRVHTDQRVTQQYEELLRKHDVNVSRNRGKQLLMGLLWCALPVFVVGSLIYVLVLVPVFDFNLFSPFVYNDFSCSVTMLLVALVLVPVLFWQEGKHADADHITRPGSGVLAKARELLTRGPRLFLQAIGKRGERQRDTAVITRAASLLGQLHNAGVGISPKSIVIPGEDMATFDAAAHYLVRGGWAGRSQDASKLWLSSEAKRRMEKSVKVR
ncbi:MAG: hypothetical protein AAGD32_16870 [Planctomycetota bacterium]